MTSVNEMLDALVKASQEQKQHQRQLHYQIRYYLAMLLADVPRQINLPHRFIMTSHYMSMIRRVIRHRQVTIASPQARSIQVVTSE